MIGTGEYISRADAIEAMYKDAEAHPNHSFWVSQFEALMDIPAADVRPVVKAQWSEYEDELWGETIKSYRCSNCHHLISRTTIIKNFCPNCGALMEES
jgi:lipopolysaccharide biosynthesis regulator YciM